MLKIQFRFFFATRRAPPKAEKPNFSKFSPTAGPLQKQNKFLFTQIRRPRGPTKTENTDFSKFSPPRYNSLPAYGRSFPGQEFGRLISVEKSARLEVPRYLPVTIEYPALTGFKHTYTLREDAHQNIDLHRRLDTELSSTLPQHQNSISPGYSIFWEMPPSLGRFQLNLAGWRHF